MRRRFSFPLVLVLACLLAVPTAARAGDKALQALADAAARLVEHRGEAAFPELRRPGRFFGPGRAVFVFDEQGFELVNPFFPELEGKNLLNHRDPTGKLVLEEELRLARGKGGFVDSVWERPGGGRPMRTRAFVQGVRHGGRLYVVGAWRELE
jgi:signal transduction histidine kinase